MRYTFSETTVAEFYDRQFYSISNADGKIVAYSEKVFDIPETVTFYGEYRCLIFEKAEIRGGEIWGGEIRGGEIWGGEIRGGVIWGGEIRGGEIRGGEIWGGVIWGGVIWGGEIWGGEIRGGVIWGGVIWGGKYEITLLQIQGSQHYCYATPTDSGEIELGIGCHIHTIEFWQENYKSIGKYENYSPDQIAEYKEYIDLFARRYKK